MCGRFIRYLLTLVTPSPSEVRGALIIALLGLAGVAYDMFKKMKSPELKYRTYEAKIEIPPVDTTYFLYERKLYVRRRPKPKVVNVNRAGLEDLVSLPGIGPKLAKRIIEYREKFGSFEKPEDLIRVKGIGKKKLQKIRPYLRF